MLRLSWKMVSQQSIAISSPVVSELQSAHVVLAKVTKTGGDSYVIRVSGGGDGGDRGGRIEERRRSPELIIFDPGRVQTRTQWPTSFFCNRVRLIPRTAERYPGDRSSRSEPPIRRPRRSRYPLQDSPTTRKVGSPCKSMRAAARDSH